MIQVNKHFPMFYPLEMVYIAEDQYMIKKLYHCLFKKQEFKCVGQIDF